MARLRLLPQTDRREATTAICEGLGGVSGFVAIPDEFGGGLGVALDVVGQRAVISEEDGPTGATVVVVISNSMHPTGTTLMVCPAKLRQADVEVEQEKFISGRDPGDES